MHTGTVDFRKKKIHVLLILDVAFNRVNNAIYIHPCSWKDFWVCWDPSQNFTQNNSKREHIHLTLHKARTTNALEHCVHRRTISHLVLAFFSHHLAVVGLPAQHLRGHPEGGAHE